MKLSIIVTGATGMVGEGVLLECLQDPTVEQVLMVNRKPFSLTHPKLRECIVPDFLNLDVVTAQLTGYSACFYCAGVSSLGKKEAEYTHVTYDTTLHFAGVLAHLNPQMTFCYVSGSQTDSSGMGRVMWARVKGRTENALTRVGFSGVFNFRPGFMKPVPGQTNVPSFYVVVAKLFPLAIRLFPNQGCELRELGLAMIHCALRGAPKQILENKDIKALAQSQP